MDRESCLRKMISSVVTLGALGVVCTTAAAGPWESFNPFKSRVEADSKKDYRIGEENGPWMILATTFAGENAEQEAHALVIELRKKHKIPAYLHRKRFDFSDTVDGRGVNRFGDRRRLRYRQNVAFDEWAVLVGDFASIDLPEVKRTLDEIKTMNPSSLELDKTRSQRFRGYREAQKRIKKLSGRSQKREKGPMGSAFVTRNPVLPKEFFTPRGIDRFVYDLNKQQDYNLIDCPGKYTVRVATFHGNAVVDQHKIKEINRGEEAMSSRLAQAAALADKLAKALHAEGVDAYQFHDRTESIVTVGSFESVGNSAGGQFVIDSAMQRTIDQFRSQKVRLPDGAINVQPRVVAGIPCDLDPIPFEVPRYSVSSDYAQAGLFR